MAGSVIRVVVWGENRHSDVEKAVYPDGVHEAIAEGVRVRLGKHVAVQTATLDEPDHGLPEDVLSCTDVLVWWGHVAHAEVADEVAERVQRRVLEGLGLLVLHSAMQSKVFMRLMGTSCNLMVRDGHDRQLVWTVSPSHPIAVSVPHPLIIPEDEMYGEFFDIPPPDELVFISSFSGGEVFRSGCCFRRGNGRIFLFTPGHETLPVYYQGDVRTVIGNAVVWAYNETPSSTVLSNSIGVENEWFRTGHSPVWTA